MTTRRLRTLLFAAVCWVGCDASAQTSSLGARKRQIDAGKVISTPSRETPRITRNQTYDRYSWVSVPEVKRKNYGVGDLITIIVSERRTFRADAEVETEKKVDVDAKLQAFLKLTQGGVGAATFQRGEPAVKFTFDTAFEADGEIKRRDNLTLRLTGKVIDIKPNGLLVIEARGGVTFDEETTVMTLTGTCRKEDVTADNTVLSTQLADKDIVIQNSGVVRQGTTRGWISKLLDWLRPI